MSTGWARGAGVLAAGLLVALGDGPAGAWRLPPPPRLSVAAGGVRLGLRVVETTPQLRTALGVRRDKGVLVMEVEPGGPAARAGLTAGDVVTRVADAPVGDPADIRAATADRKPGDKVPVEYVRDRRVQAATVELAAAPGHRLTLGPWRVPLPDFELPPDVAQELRRFRERVERDLRELDRRLRRFREEDPEEPATRT